MNAQSRHPNNLVKSDHYHMCRDFYFSLYFYLFSEGYVEFLTDFNNMNKAKVVIARYSLLFTNA